jgi:protein-disulfide isomerase
MTVQFKGQLLALVGGMMALSLAACAPSAPQLKKVIEENPDIIYAAIQKDPKKFLEIVNDAAMKARAQEEQKMMEDEMKKREAEFASPKTPELPEGRAFVGPKDAPITIVEYSDFQCPYCKRGHQTVKEVMAAYDGKVKVYFKNFPIDRIHPHAMAAARWFEAVALQDFDKAFKFKALVFENQDKLNVRDDKDAEKVLEGFAKSAGADVAKAKAALKGEEVQKRIDADRKEAEAFGFSGTPGYLINGVSLKGAYPIEDFKAIIEKHLAAKK